MWSYYGSKTNIADIYPPPEFNTIIEPFAGAAKYSLVHFENDVYLYDKYEAVIKIWLYLKDASVKDILGLPRITRKQKLSDFNLSEAENLLMGFIIAKGGQSPRNTPSPNATTNRPNTINYQLKKISQQLFKIRHWHIEHKSYTEIDNTKATWFIDPPYQFGGHVYVYSNKNIDFTLLADWCKCRNGRIIVCENIKANWLPFASLNSPQRTSAGWQNEAIWTNFKTRFNTPHKTLFDV